MNRHLLLAPVVVLLAPLAYAADLKVQPDAENVVAGRLEGNWTASTALTERLAGNAEWRVEAISFKSDPSIAARVPEKYAKFFTGRQMRVYLAGHAQFRSRKSRGKKLPFILTRMHGNPHIFIWIDKDGDSFGNVESFNVMLAVARDRQKDLLFIGGDFNNQPFSALERKQDETR